MTTVAVLGGRQAGKSHLMGLLESMGVEVLRHSVVVEIHTAHHDVIYDSCPIELELLNDNGKRGKKGKRKKDWQL